MAEKRYGFVIDTTRCQGCNTCGVVCKMENNVPHGIFWNRTMTEGGVHNQTPAGDYPEHPGDPCNLSMHFYTVNCQHCENPACVKVCPVGATYKDAETGVVRQDYDKCIGCRMCMAACPYTGVRSFNWEEPKYFLDFPTGDPNVPCLLYTSSQRRQEEPGRVAFAEPRRQRGPRREASCVLGVRQDPAPPARSAG